MGNEFSSYKPGTPPVRYLHAHYHLLPVHKNYPVTSCDMNDFSRESDPVQVGVVATRTLR